MTANFSLYIVDGDWIAKTPDPTYMGLSDEVVYEQLHLGQSSVDWVFEHRTDTLRYLTNGEFGPDGGYAEWDGSDCFMGFISAKAAAEIARILSEISPEELMKAATWIEDEFRDSVSDCLKFYYSDLRQFIEKAVAGGNGLACMATN